MPQLPHIDSDRSSRQRLNTLTLTRPRCPVCKGIALRKYRSLRDQGDGSALSWVECMARGCKHRFRLLME
jgi:hypothetical protein